MTSLTIKLPDSLRQKVESTARISGRSVSSIVRDAITNGLPTAPAEPSLFERTKDLCGKGKSGIPDLASNPGHLEGYGV